MTTSQCFGVSPSNSQPLSTGGFGQPLASVSSRRSHSRRPRESNRPVRGAWPISRPKSSASSTLNVEVEHAKCRAGGNRPKNAPSTAEPTEISEKCAREGSGPRRAGGSPPIWLRSGQTKGKKPDGGVRPACVGPTVYRKFSWNGTWSLHLPSSRPSGADPVKLHNQMARFGSSIAGMPPVLPYRRSDGAIVLYGRVTLGHSGRQAMQRACGTGGTVKNGQIEIQGDKRAEVARILTEARFQPVFAGG